ncbi:hypothetical protein J2S17_003244 [Cytobacillus purgationiresistens]|uniref:Uncharacterized protein n=1 Tax=Cytobacillus purgationiresistens TaxID=863449 RepID=A0ABU0AKU8_9BACI|nr:hypothetical protein [Cytobacillus purgationiresistens]
MIKPIANLVEVGSNELLVESKEDGFRFLDRMVW